MRPRQAMATTPSSARIDYAATASAGGDAEIRDYLRIAVEGLPQMWNAVESEFAQTARAVKERGTTRLRVEGTNQRYSAIVALGASRLAEPEQRALLGDSAAVFTTDLCRRAEAAADPGVVALAAWASAEVTGEPAGPLFDRIESLLDEGAPVDTVVCAWMLTAGLALPPGSTGERIADMAAARLLAGQGPNGAFPHVLPAHAQHRARAHVGCFADQVYPIQALARLGAARSDAAALDAANRAAAVICTAQGPSGQWWWHYDVRDGSIVEGYPVYSVHQHAMAPMALFELAEAGGSDHRDSIMLGTTWLASHPETVDEMVSRRWSLIWRKVGRYEPAKAARRLAAVTTALRPGLHVPGMTRALPAGRIDHECRPYELGWLLYAWLADGVALPRERGEQGS